MCFCVASCAFFLLSSSVESHHHSQGLAPTAEADTIQQLTHVSEGTSWRLRAGGAAVARRIGESPIPPRSLLSSRPPPVPSSASHLSQHSVHHLSLMPPALTPFLLPWSGAGAQQVHEPSAKPISSSPSSIKSIMPPTNNDDPAAVITTSRNATPPLPLAYGVLTLEYR